MKNPFIIRKKLEAQGASATNIHAADKLKEKQKGGGFATRYACNMIVNLSKIAPITTVQAEVTTKIQAEMQERKKKHPEYTSADILKSYDNSDFHWMISKIGLSWALFEGIAQEVCK